jgi:tetratricopeptide (TPR) repeat protein
MLLAVVIAKSLIELSLMFIVGRFLLGLMAGPKRDQNVFWQLLDVASKPALWITRKISPNDVLALNTLGYNELNDRRQLQALGFFERALALTPANANAHFNVGFVCEALGRSQEAEQAFRKALQIDEKLDRAWYGLGLVLVRQQRFEESLVAFQRNTELQSMSPYAWYQMARVHMEMQAPDKALEVMRHLNGFEPKVAAQLERETGLQLSRPA